MDAEGKSILIQKILKDHRFDHLFDWINLIDKAWDDAWVAEAKELRQKHQLANAKDIADKERIEP